MPSDHRPHVRRGRSAVVLTSLVLIVVLTGCALGKRPTLVEAPTADAGTAADVVDLLQNAVSATFTATYQVTPSLTGTTTEATVIQAGARQRITIGDVEFFTDGTTSRTCVTGTDQCVDGFDDARISNLSITHAFYSQSAAQRLANESSRAVGTATRRSDTIAEQPASCIDLPLPGQNGEVGTMTICALEAGPLARFFGADVSIELTSFSASVDSTRL